MRFFVDALLEVGSISPEERARIDAQMAGSNRSRRVEEVLGEATTLLSGLSHCAGRRGGAQDQCPAQAYRIREPGAQPRPRHPGRRGRHGREPHHRSARRPAALGTRQGIELSLGAHAGQDDRRSAAAACRKRSTTLKTELDDLTAKVIAAGVATWSGNTEEDDRTLIVKGQANLIENLTALEDLERIRKLFDDIENKKG